VPAFARLGRTPETQEENMYAVIQSGGKQYRVAPGDTIRVETIPFESGETLELGGLLAVSKDSGEVLTGDAISNAKVVAQVTGHGRGQKVIVFKFKRKKQYKRTYGHRQNYTELKVTDVAM
jgi:large subunit ribosomal protein L21